MRSAGGAAAAPEPLPGELLAELLAVVREVNSVLDADALLPTIARTLRRILDYELLEIFLADPQAELVLAHAVGYDARAAGRQRIALGQGTAGAAAASREVVFEAGVAAPLVPGVVSEMGIPLLHRDRLVGVLHVGCSERHALHESARAALGLLGSHLAAAIENANLYREARWYAGLLATLYEVGKETASILDLDQLLHRVAELVKHVIDYEMFGILLLDESRGELVLRKSVSYGSIREKTRIKLGTGLCGTAALIKQPVLVGDVQRDPRYLNLIPETRSELVVPLLHKDRVVGVLDLESTQLDHFNPEQLKVLTPLASQVAGAIENARLYEELRRRDRRLHHELALAGQVQHGLFPEECPQGEGWQASAHFRPARELGGDLYDFYELPDGQLGLAVGDVAGKGVAAALYGAFASGTVRSRAFERRAPADLLARVNRTLGKRGVDGLFCTLAYAVFDFPQQLLRLASSGLPYPLHYSAARRRCDAIEVAGLPLGAFPGTSYEELTVPLAPGDVFIFHTDGITEAARGSEEYGTARLRALVEAHADEPADALGETILEDVDRFIEGRPRNDDLTLVVMRIR
ncbi:MAG TPA: SpoIIE family protein phosphatase [Vicinamibacteria bacterium]